MRLGRSNNNSYSICGSRPLTFSELSGGHPSPFILTRKVGPAPRWASWGAGAWRGRAVAAGESPQLPYALGCHGGLPEAGGALYPGRYTWGLCLYECVRVCVCSACMCVCSVSCMCEYVHAFLYCVHVYVHVCVQCVCTCVTYHVHMV